VDAIAKGWLRTSYFTSFDRRGRPRPPTKSDICCYVVGYELSDATAPLSQLPRMLDQKAAVALARSLFRKGADFTAGKRQS
jgi:hypothetical protein